MENWGFIATVVGVLFVGFIGFGLVLMKLYRRATKERAFVRTGAGGQKVVKDGGAVVIPMFHEVIDVNMQTLRLQVERKRQEALITKDRLRVDVMAEFYVRVKPDSDGIATAAQTLGRRTMEPRELSALVEGKFVDALRSVAAQMEMQELHENRVTFVQRVQTTVAEDLAKNGLELESVSLTGLDQTPAEFFNPNNAFDAEGLAKLTSITEEKNRQRNEIQAKTRVAIEEENLKANQRSLEISREQEYAQMAQEREVATRRAEQQRVIAEQEAEQNRAAEIARITAEQATEAARIAKNQKVKENEIDAAKAIELAQQDQKIAIAKKSEENSKAQADAAKARASAVAAEEAVVTAKETAIAERNKNIAVIEATKVAEQDAVGIKVAAAAEKAAAEDRAAALIIEAEAEAETIQIKAEAKAKDFEVEAAGRRALNEAENTLDIKVLSNRVRLTAIEQMPSILEQMVKPLENIEGVRVHMLSGLGGVGGVMTGTDGKPTATGGSVANQVIDGLLNFRLQSPAVDALAKQIGMDISSVTGASSLLTDEFVDDVDGDMSDDNEE
jgi:uncharacterized membrane protein YqiK